ncbi:hypothetical protein DICPUDRAFT_81130 [Dictyostelium purpureum]|uniref:Nuclear pore membrane glycoprotein n=1 Tax=Dictyostelium purpureum TaxID=5786 RepID=F0ZSK7_DICPU|nr:uncharacterized protein DICPUDRAFT_81130 [Dictyostelium purpureum]EGC33088.1 hypothetical protein DICPUDRAFT_81130 [Dictyostelium purpureum]|eukprot:XP_003290401.1 hypothetical protein DICPUDRAFT_81130 [Dictyostelium purpureum]
MKKFTPVTPQLNLSSSLCIPGTKINYKLLTKNRTFLKNIPNSTPTYIWNPKVGNISIVDVNSKGVIANNNCAGSVVIVQEPDQIVFSSSQVEVEVGKKLVLSTKLLSKHLPKGVYFESCSINNLEWKVKDDSIFKILPHEKVDQQKISSDICSSREFLALKEGSTVISVQYNGIREEIRIFASPPADQMEVLLSLDSSAEVSFCGGKETWHLEPKIYSKTFSSDNKEQNSLSITPGDNNSFKVTCQKQSNDPQNVIVTIRNKKSISSPLPEAHSIKIPFFCRQPSYVHIQFIKLPNEEEGKQIIQSSNPIHQDSILSLKKQKSGEISRLNIHNNSDLPFIAMNSIAKYVKGSTNYPIIVAGSIFIAAFAIGLYVYKINLNMIIYPSNTPIKSKFFTLHSRYYKLLTKNRTFLKNIPNSTYIWNPKVGNTSIVDVNSKGVIANNNFARSVVNVQEPDQIVFSSSQVEVEVGKKLVLSTKLLSKHLPKGVYFESCSINNLEWKVKDDSIFKILPHEKVDQQKISSDICSSREFLALKEGSTVISVQYNGMREEIRIFASPPADQIEFLLSLGSSAEVSFCGGKETWLLQPKIYSKFISSDNKEQNSLSITPGDNNSFKVTCQKQSNDPQNVIVTIRNKKSISSPLPEARSIKIPFFCRQPSYVHIQFIKLPTEEEGKQKSGEISRLNIHSNSDLPFIAMNSIAKYVKGSTNYPIIVAGSIFIAAFAIGLYVYKKHMFIYISNSLLESFPYSLVSPNISQFSINL